MGFCHAKKQVGRWVPRCLVVVVQCFFFKARRLLPGFGLQLLGLKQSLVQCAWLTSNSFPEELIIVGTGAIDGRGLFLLFGCKCIVFYSIFLCALTLTGTGKHHVFSIFAHILQR